MSDVTQRCTHLHPGREVLCHVAARAAQDCAIAVALTPVAAAGGTATEDDDDDGYIVEAVDGTRWRWAVQFLDLDPPAEVRLEDWYREDQELVATYKGVALGPTAAAAAKQREDDENLQIGGHNGAIRVSAHKVYKRCDSPAEMEFYARTAHHPRLKPFIPDFFGTETRSDGSYVVLENLLHGLATPMMLDLKMGTRTYGDDADPDKVAKQRAKASCTTSGRLGVMVVGCQVPLNDLGTEKLRLGRKANHDVLTEEAVVIVLGQFLHTPKLRKEALGFVSRLHEYFQTQTEFAFYGSSLFFAYDAALGKDASLRVKMIDFAHVHPPPNDGLDESYLTGLTFLQRVLELPT